jgi:hypothetical protein
VGWEDLREIAKREAARQLSLVGGQGKGLVACTCKGKCNSNHCSCLKNNRKCGSACHRNNFKCVNHDSHGQEQDVFLPKSAHVARTNARNKYLSHYQVQVYLKPKPKPILYPAFLSLIEMSGRTHPKLIWYLGKYIGYSKCSTLCDECVIMTSVSGSGCHIASPSTYLFTSTFFHLSHVDETSITPRPHDDVYTLPSPHPSRCRWGRPPL